MNDAIQGKAPARIVVSRSDPHAVIAVKTPSRLVIIARGSQVGAALASSVAVSQADVVLGRDSSGPGGAQELPCTAYARSLLATASAAAARVALGVVIGTNVAAQATSLAGYGIADAYTKTQVDALIAGYEPLDPDLAAIAALGTTGYLKRTAADTWALSVGLPWADVTGAPNFALVGASYTTAAADARFAPIAVPWASITGEPTTATGYGIASIDNVPIGATTASTGKFTTVQTTGVIGVAAAPSVDVLLTLANNAIHPSTASTMYGVNVNYQVPATGTANVYGYRSILQTVASAFTLAGATHFLANQTVLGAGSAITTVRGFYAANAIAVGVTNYGFYTDINDAPNTYGFYSAGTAASRFTGSLGIGSSVSNASEALRITLPATITAASVVTINMNSAAPATTTSALSQIFFTASTAASAFTCPEINGVRLNQFTLGAGSTLNALNGFYVNSLYTNDVAGTTVRGFYSLLSAGANATVYQLYMGGTAMSFFQSAVGIGLAPTVGTSMLAIRGSALTSANPILVAMDATLPSTATGSAWGFKTTALNTAASSFTLAALTHFGADASTVGAGSTITKVIGFWARNNIAVGGTNYGFFSDIAAATNTYQLYMQGTAESIINGPLSVGTTLAASLNGAAFFYVGGANPHPSTATTVYGAKIDYTVPSTGTGTPYGLMVNVRTAAAAFTPASVRMISAEAVVLGAGSSITTVYGFMARNGIAQGGANYGFYSDIALNGANNYQLYMSSTGLNYFGGAVGIGNASPLTAGAMFIVGGTSQVTAATGYAVLANQTAPATMTSAYHGFYSSLLTAASAFTMGSLVHFRAAATTVGAGSAITNVYGLLVSAAAAVSGATNYGTYLELASATSTWNVYAAGTAQNFFGGPVGILATGPLTTGALLQIGSASAHPGVTTSIFGATSDYVGAATATTSHRGYVSVLRSAASAYTVTDVIHFDASTTVLGAGSTITNVYGFRVTSAVAPSAAGSVYGYYSALVAATGVFAFYGAGTAPSLFGGALIEKEITETYGTTVTIDARLGNERIVTVTNTTAWTMAAPTNPTTGQYLEITVRNTSGGVAGAITWNTAFKMTAFTNPANGFSRTIVFRYNGTNWVEKGRTAADVPN